jgi:hypothetical protein
MKKKRDEIKDRVAIKQCFDHFALVNEILENVNEGYPIARKRRNNFAIRMFATEAIHYGIFLILFTAMAFLNFSRNDQYDYYLSKGIEGNIYW